MSNGILSLGLRESARIRSWRDDPEVVAAWAQRKALVASIETAENDQAERIAAARRALDDVEHERDLMTARTFASGGTVDLSAIAARVDQARTELRAAETEVRDRRRALQIFDDEVFPSIAGKAIRAQVNELLARYASLVPKLKAAALKVKEYNDIVAELDAIARADIDSLHPAVRAATFDALPGNMHLPVNDRVFEWAAANWENAGF